MRKMLLLALVSASVGFCQEAPKPAAPQAQLAAPQVRRASPGLL